VIFSNGLLDPWRAGGITYNLTNPVSLNTISLLIEKSAHHFDLREDHPEDPQSVKDARDIEEALIGVWIQEYESIKMESD